MKLSIPALLRGIIPLALATVAGALTSCSSVNVASSAPASEAASPRLASSGGSAARAVVEHLPSTLGTGWGESRQSKVTESTFERAHPYPDGVGRLYYNSPGNVVRPVHGGTFRGLRDVAGGVVAIGVKDEHGRWLEGIERGERDYVIGEAGSRYELVVSNRTSKPIEVVLSVDGLDVLDGKSASYSKRGHIIKGKGTLTIPGWRTSSSSVAAFRFSSVADSYASRKYGETRNLGVIGVAVFTEKQLPSRVYAEPPPLARGSDPSPFPGERKRWAGAPQG